MRSRFRRVFHVRVQRQKGFDEPGGSQDSGSLIKTVPSTQLDAIKKANSPRFEIARVLVLLDHIARFIVNANYGIV